MVITINSYVNCRTEVQRESPDTAKWWALIYSRHKEHVSFTNRYYRRMDRSTQGSTQCCSWPTTWLSTHGGPQVGLSQLPLFPFQDLFWSEGEGENKTKNKRTTNRMQLRHTIVVLDPKRWDLYFSLALMLASIIVRSPDYQGLEKNMNIRRLCWCFIITYCTIQG